ncbi:hypothetical protein OG596_35025 [Streptomyces sp. NBC_01102]|uniref:hypothetical protein n=1 Tax=Streptomyces sp. NBC_01102 TaxID=2903749 RepID=UPI00386C750C|nr:hypothetical protein OG596_35025 [Streptomyces sp. NBC_01102]
MRIDIQVKVLGLGGQDKHRLDLAKRATEQPQGAVFGAMVQDGLVAVGGYLIRSFAAPSPVKCTCSPVQPSKMPAGVVNRKTFWVVREGLMRGWILPP